MSATISVAAMRALEARVMASGAVTGAALMERAGAGVVAAIRARWPEVAPLASADHVPASMVSGQDAETGAPVRAVVLCGPGNNGGDGFVVARLLAGSGWRVEVFFLGEADRLPPDARTNHDLWCKIGPVARLSLPVPTGAEIADLCRAASPGQGTPLVLIDALFGIGLTRPLAGLEGLTRHWAGVDPGAGCLRVAVDLPSGLDGDTGDVVGGAGGGILPADLTVTFHAMKPGHRYGRKSHACGEVVVVDIGLPDA